MDINKSVKAILIGGVSEIIICILLFVLTAFALTKVGYIPDGVIATVTTVLSAASCFFGGLISGRIVKKAGMLVGAASGFLLFFIQLAISLMSGTIGGIFGVNKKEKI